MYYLCNLCVWHTTRLKPVTDFYGKKQHQQWVDALCNTEVIQSY